VDPTSQQETMYFLSLKFDQRHQKFIFIKKMHERAKTELEEYVENYQIRRELKKWNEELKEEYDNQYNNYYNNENSSYIDYDDLVEYDSIKY